MKSISDVIEEFILDQLTDGQINLSRNELANFFNCAPSQINYVITTRFTPSRGFDVESRRGGGGYIKISKLISSNKSDYVYNLINNYIKDEIDYNNASLILDNLLDNEIITNSERDLIAVAISNKSLSNPIKMESKIRAKILTNLLISLIKED